MQIVKHLIMNFFFFQILVSAVITDLAKFFGTPIVEEEFDC